MRSGCTSKTGKQTTTKSPNRNPSACPPLKSQSDAEAATAYRTRNHRSARKEGVSVSSAERKPQNLQRCCRETCDRTIPCPEGSPPETVEEHHARRRNRTGRVRKPAVIFGEDFKCRHAPTLMDNQLEFGFRDN